MSEPEALAKVCYPSLTLQARREPQVWSLSRKRRCPPKGGPNPTWAGPCSSRKPCSKSERTYAASLGQQWPLSEGPGKVNPGGATPALSACQAPEPAEALAKRRLVRSERHAVSSDVRRGDSWSRPDTTASTLTGESPTLFQSSGQPRAHKSMTNRLGSRSGTRSGPTLLAQGWQRPQSKAPARKGTP